MAAGQLFDKPYFEINAMSNALKPVSPEERKWGMIIHLSALIGLLLPLGLVLGPLLVWMLKKDEGDYFNQQGKKAVNFQLTILIIAFAVAVLSFVIRPLISIAFMAGMAGIVFAVIAGVQTNKGEDYQYPFSFKLL